MVPRVQISKKWPQGPKDPALPAVIFGQKHCHVNPQRVGGNYPNENQKGYYFETKCRIDLKPGCKFKFFEAQASLGQGISLSQSASHTCFSQILKLRITYDDLG